MAMRWGRFALVALLIVVALVVLGAVAIGLAFRSAAERDGSYIGLVRIEGAIEESLDLVQRLQELRADENLVALLVRIDSPGGAIGASQEIYQVLRGFEDDSIPVVVSMGNLAASGGLYCSLAGRKVFALPGTVTGSIGVITQFPEAAELLAKLGLKMETVKSGPLKDAGSPFRAVTDKDRASLGALVNELYGQFVDEVAARRHLSRDSVLVLADGRVFSGRQAVALGLADTLGTYADAVQWLQDEYAGEEDLPVVDTEPEPGLMDRLMAGPGALSRQLFAKRNTPAWVAP
jgi:protease-4